MSNRVNVLLSTFNGEKYLPDLLDSLLRQTHPDWLLSVRDDGSSDGTLRILEKYRSSFPGMRIFEGANIGVVESFFTLLREGDPGCDFFAFCDQDDVWQPGKLAEAVRRLGEANPRVPALYCSRVEIVDEALKHLNFSKVSRRPGFGNALVENISSGCTLTMNSLARELTLSSLPEWALMHDWWCYLVVSGFGTILYDPTPQVRYRQHGHNAVGCTSSQWDYFTRRMRRFLRNTDGVFRVTDQGRMFDRCFGERLDREKRAILDNLLRSKSNFRSRLRYALFPMEVWRQSKVDTIILRVLILFGRY